MAPKSLLLAASLLVGATYVAAQAAPNWELFPKACATDCAATIETSYLCQSQYSDSTSIYGCFCNDYPSDASTCATCLNSNDAAALATLVTSTQTACPSAISQCFFECSFETCASTDISCQCAGSYLENIFNCASCNTANGNTAATQISDFNSLQESCANQNYTGASQSFTTEDLPSPTTDGYTAPTLTGTGGGVAATADATATDGALAATAADSSGTSAASASTPATTSAASAASHASTAASTAKSSGSAASKAASGTASKAASGTASASASTSSAASAANALVAPFAGAIGIAALAALF